MEQTKPRSGKLLAVNDTYIDDLLADPLYEVRPDGTIWTLRNKQGHIGTEWRKSALSPKRDYVFFHYGPKDGRHQLSMHRIIYRAFIGELQPDLVINHKDGNGHNNSLDNLELVTQSKNNTHRFQDLGHAAIKGNRSLTDEQVLEIRTLQSQGWTNKRLREKFGVSKSTISYVVNRRSFGDIPQQEISIVEPLSLPNAVPVDDSLETSHNAQLLERQLDPSNHN